MVKVCILGYGGIARAHRHGYELLEKAGADVQVLAACDINPKQFETVVKINQGGQEKKDEFPYKPYTDLDKMLEECKPDIVDICLPTYLHCEYAVRLLEKGYNVQCEKPMALNSEQCAKMLEARDRSGKQLMIGMCLRFDNTYLVLKDMIDSGKYGKVKSARFERLSALPGWGFDGWYHDYNRAGGVALDMHIHDVDMIRFLFGEPEAVSAFTYDGQVKCETVNTNFIYNDKLVSATGDWGLSKTERFHSPYRVVFEEAVVHCDRGVITVFPNEGEKFTLEYEVNEHMSAEEKFFSEVVQGKRKNEKNMPEDAAKTVALVEKIRESAEKGGIPVKVK